ncbi:MAG: hypothetical protein AB7S26_21945 [Sandaracinaceae bacterium]
MSNVLCLAPLLVEAAPLMRAGLPVTRIGMGRARATTAAVRLASTLAEHVMVVGFGGALDPQLEPGDVVLASSISALGMDPVTCDVERVRAILDRERTTFRVSPIASSDELVRGADARRALREATGAAAVDMESAWLTPLARGRRFDVLRVIVDTERAELTRPLATLEGGVRAMRVLDRLAQTLRDLPHDKVA